MRYRVSVSIGYVAGGALYPEAARASLDAEIARRLAASLEDLDVSVWLGTTVTVAATLRGTAPHELTSPLDALSRLDSCVLRALAVTGQFEEFDVVRRTLDARPA
ncbi:hypothetical protein GCM10009557_86660 [Virgisporangium ochraceum]|jgi:hypothetical protein|uniref:Uncharacterized protein n=1 Tax=Virgisporangium ochraceum TaxID=65505 RepID=A0A8J3ZM87_9ACTN|nr:hypothetical protein [Virgisporangium ochraceum]GIJ66617.1 hypothetical protein Voc01_015340 [Virgisporangium ochraceum]